jgi:hypothetical protein
MTRLNLQIELTTHSDTVTATLAFTVAQGPGLDAAILQQRYREELRAVRELRTRRLHSTCGWR